LNWVNGKLEGSLYLAGDAISASDILLLPVMQALARAAGKDVAASLDLQILPLEVTYPNIAGWLTRIQALPGYENTYPPHWRE